MSMQFTIDAWEPAEHDTLEICKTAGALRISVDEHSLTRNEDGWSQTVKQTVRVSAYPLALWLAASWWRLRWEPLPSTRTAPSAWRLAHEIASAGDGFLWPRIVFACDGVNMNVWSVPTTTASEQPIQYLSDSHHVVSVEDFTNAVDNFLYLVLDRLDAVQLSQTELKSLWQEVLEERNDADTSAYRRIEAMLGFDPDEVDEAVVATFLQFGHEIGGPALGEIATTCASVSLNPLAHLEQIHQVAKMKGITGKFVVPDSAKNRPVPYHQRPWSRGRQLALMLREELGLNGEAIGDADLSALAEVRQEDVFGETTPTERLPLGIGIRKEQDDHVKLVLRKRNRVGRRFEFARLLCDHLLSDETDRWLPATDAKTARQKWQRSFAAEFLCPVDALLCKLGDDFSEDAVDDAASHFGVSERTVTSQLVNHGYLDVSELEEQTGPRSYPYLI